jgi:hypothetical protein
MIEIIPSSDEVIAMRVSHKLTGLELDAIMDRLDAAMANSRKVHIFVETHAIDGIELAGLAAYAQRAMPLFGKLDHFGRVAVVADQAWIRLAAKVESALLPFISYRTFMPADRDEALNWVRNGD